MRTQGVTQGALAVALVLLAACRGGSERNRQDLAKAEFLYKQHLYDDAKRVVVDVLHRQPEAAARARGLHLLGTIALEQGQLALALDNFNVLVNEIPESPEAQKVKPRLGAFEAVVAEIKSDSFIEDPMARAYLTHGDFWARERARIFQIDSSWIDEIDAAVKWYDLVIKDFDGTPAARSAYEQKLFALFGWRGTGQYDEPQGLRGNAKKYLPMIVETFRAFEKAFPTAPSLPAFRYQIAQAYWAQRDWDETRRWLNDLIQKEGSKQSFYRDLAERRLQKIEF